VHIIRRANFRSKFAPVGQLIRRALSALPYIRVRITGDSVLFTGSVTWDHSVSQAARELKCCSFRTSVDGRVIKCAVRICFVVPVKTVNWCESLVLLSHGSQDSFSGPIEYALAFKNFA